MIISFSKNPLQRTLGIIFWNRVPLIIFTIFATAAYFICVVSGHDFVMLPGIPVTILGGALAIFLGFRNSSAYDRWWEARKVWGAVVNHSRSFGLELITYPIGKDNAEEEVISEWRKKAVLRHIGWLYALNAHLRKEKADLG